MSDNEKTLPEPADEDSYRHMSALDLAAWGIDDVAYVKPVVIEGEAAFSIHSADGKPLGVSSAREMAFATVRHHDLEPVSVH